MDSTLPTVLCQNFRANLWRPHTCSNCYRSKSSHQLQYSEPRASRSLFKKLTASPKSRKKELRQVASIATLNRDRIERREWEEMPQRSLKSGPMVGVVKPYAVVDIDEDSDIEDKEESNLDSMLKRRQAEAAKQQLDSTCISSETVNSSLTVVKTNSMNGSNQSLDKLSIAGEANMLETSPKPARVIGRLLNEYHRSMSVTAIDKPPGKGSRDKPTRGNRGKSVEPLDAHKTQQVSSIKRSSSLRQEVPKSSKIMSLLSRRKVSSPCTEIKPLASSLKTQRPLSSVTIFAAQPKVTSPHPVRRNKATVYPHSLLVSKKYKKEVKVPARPRKLSFSKPPGSKPTPLERNPSPPQNERTPQEKKTISQEEKPCEVEPVKKKRVPPPKPPRTLSTFFTSPEQEMLFKQLLLSGDIQDIAIKGRMINELQTVEAAAAKVGICPPRRSRRGQYDEVMVRPQGEVDSQPEPVSRLPLGHSGDYAEVFSSSGSTFESASTELTAEPDYDSLEKQVPPTPHTQCSHSSLTMDSPSIQSPDDKDLAYYSLPCTIGRLNSSSEEDKHISPPPLSLDKQEQHYSVPCSSPQDNTSTLSAKSSKKLSLPSATPASHDFHVLMANTLEHVIQRETEKLVSTKSLWEIKNWEGIKILSETEAVYEGITFSIKDAETIGTELQNSIKTSKHLTPHLHLRLVRSMMTTPPTPSTTPTPSLHYLLTDHAGTDATSFLLSHRHTLTHDIYTEQVLLTLIQVFSALKYLHINGICHRDVGIESVYGHKMDGHWLVKLGDFNYALKRSAPIDSTTFVYGYHELEWLGGVDSRLPPEVIDTPENAQTVDFTHTDSFSVGCMIYELCGRSNPFETNPDLIFQQYTVKDLPSFEIDAKLTPHLQRLASLLVRCDTSERLSSSTALLICQALKWLPVEWLSSLPPEEQVKEHLLMERGQLVCELAKREERSVPLELLLKAQFLRSCDVPELMLALSAFAVN